MTSEELSYAAGFFDGEGCIFIAHYPHYKASCYNYTFTVSVNQTSIDVLLWLKEKFGGCVCEKKAKAYENRKRLWCWSARSQQAEDFLKLLLPFLKVKYEHALIALQFRSTYHKDEWRPSDETKKERNQCIEKMRALMKKGRH